MKSIPLTLGQVALVDDADFEWLSQWKWCAHAHKRGGFYAVRALCEPGKKKRVVSMHKLLCSGVNVDHRNGNGLDNQRKNLRPATSSQNGCNRGKPKHNKSGFKGVHFDKSKGRYVVYVCANGVNKFCGRFDSKISAAVEYNINAIRMQGEFAKLNDIFSGEVPL